MARPNFNDMDWQSVLNSEIFCNYMGAELEKEASAKAELSSAEYLEKQADEQIQVKKEIDAFRAKVASSPKLQEYFTQCRKILATNKDLAKKVDPKFIEGIKLLSLGIDEAADDEYKYITHAYADFKRFIKDKYGEEDVSELNRDMLVTCLDDFCETSKISEEIKNGLISLAVAETYTF